MNLDLLHRIAYRLFFGNKLMDNIIAISANGNKRETLSAVVVFLFLAGLWFTEAIINGPNFHPKWTFAAPTIV